MNLQRIKNTICWHTKIMFFYPLNTETFFNQHWKAAQQIPEAHNFSDNSCWITCKRPHIKLPTHLKTKTYLTTWYMENKVMHDLTSKWLLRDSWLRWPKSVTAISICSQQFQFAQGNFNLLTAIWKSIWKSTTAEINIQRTTSHILQKRKIFKKHTCQSKTLKVKNLLHHETAGVVLACEPHLTSSLAKLKLPRAKLKLPWVKLKLPWANWNSCEQIEIAVSKLKLPWHFWATVPNDSKYSQNTFRRLHECFHVQRFPRAGV